MGIQGITVQLIKQVQTGADWSNHPIYEEITESVDNVLVGEPTTEDVTGTMNLYGKRVAYTIAIPKGDSHSWENATVILPEPFAGKYRTIGYPTAGIEQNIPLRWNKKVKLERYNGRESEG